jgi:drug/metabolite transporter (DMT)-like permease
MVFAMLFWGGSWTSAKLLTRIATPEVLSFWRFLLTAACLLVLAPLLRETLRIHPAGLLIMALGASLMVAYNLLYFLGLQYGLAGAGGVLVSSLSPLMIYLITTAAHRRLPRGLEAIGLAGGLAGGAVLLRVWELNAERLLASGNLFFLLGALAWALITIYSGWAQGRLSFLAYSFYLYAFSAAITFFLALPHGLLPPREAAAGFWLNTAYLAVLATSFSATVFFVASKRLGSRRAGSFMFLVPASAILTSWLVLGEIPGVTTLLGGGIMSAAVYLINRKADRAGGSRRDTIARKVP